MVREMLGFVIIFMGVSGFGNAADIFDVTQFGAVGDGIIDDSKAFVKAWAKACGESGDQTLHIPPKTFLLQPLVFSGPCTSSVQFEVEGTLLTPNPDEWRGESDKKTWIAFRNVENLSIFGKGEIDGRGESWWNKGKPNQGPTSIAFHECKNLSVKDITSTNTPRNHFSINDCIGAMISNVKLIAPKESPNTDGFDISSSQNVNISDSFIGTGDDCVAINGGCTDIYIENVNCGPGHGISVGSLGRNGNRDTVENVHVKNSTFNGTQNGARIKTCPGGSGYARHILYEQIELIEVQNPITINQHYNFCNQPDATSAVEISDVKFIGFRGTSAVKTPIMLDCSQEKACDDIVLEDIDIQPGTGVIMEGAVCNNVYGSSRNTTPNVLCLA